MKKLLTNLLVISVSVSILGCSTFYPVSATSNALTESSVVGNGCYRSLLFGIIPISLDHNSIYEAARNGKISKISTVDGEYFSIFGLYSAKCTVVHGE